MRVIRLSLLLKVWEKVSNEPELGIPHILAWFFQFLTSAVMNIFADVSLEAGSVFLRVNS